MTDGIFKHTAEFGAIITLTTSGGGWVPPERPLVGGEPWPYVVPIHDGSIMFIGGNPSTDQASVELQFEVPVGTYEIRDRTGRHAYQTEEMPASVALASPRPERSGRGGFRGRCDAARRTHAGRQMRQYEYSVDGGTDHDGRRVYTVLCRSWDDFDQDAEAWTRVVGWYADRSVALREAEAFQENADEARDALRRENEAAGFVSAAD